MCLVASVFIVTHTQYVVKINDVNKLKEPFYKHFANLLPVSIHRHMKPDYPSCDGNDWTKDMFSDNMAGHV